VIILAKHGDAATVNASRDLIAVDVSAKVVATEGGRTVSVGDRVFVRLELDVNHGHAFEAAIRAALIEAEARNMDPPGQEGGGQ
jgi:hypothetical protein